MFKRKQVALLTKRLSEPNNPLIQVVAGPRQTGKSTLIAQALEDGGFPHLFISADDVLAPSIDWIKQSWQQARNLLASQEAAHAPFVLVLDEIQKVNGWTNIVKGLWDADQRTKTNLKVVLSGSSSLLLRKGLEDSLMGRFELIYSPHWSFSEVSEAFGFSCNEFLFFGGFPGAARFTHDYARWLSYMRASIIEPTIANDVLEHEQIKKPALLRALFDLGARFSSQELSYAKMLGQLQDAGNTTTLAHYLDLLSKAGMIAGLTKYRANERSQKRTTPRLSVYDTSLMTSTIGVPMKHLFSDTERMGHLVESAVGAYLLAQAEQNMGSVFWWREGTNEVDFVYQTSTTLYAIEVKSGRIKSLRGMDAFLAQHPEAIRIIIGGSEPYAIPLESFLLGEVELS